MVAKFLKALLKGWELAMAPENEEKTLHTISRFDRDTAMDTIREQLSLTRQFIKPDPDTPIGHMDVNAWKETEDMMLNQKLILEPVHIEEYLKQVN